VQPQVPRGRAAFGPAQRRRRLIRRALLATLVFPLVAVGFAMTAMFFYFFNAVPLSPEIGSKPTVILDSTGKVEFATLQPRFARHEVPIEQLCEEGRRQICDAVLAAEDAGFYQHGGVSLPGIIRAALRNVVRGQIAEGGSTISQQYIKTATGDDERTPLRKLREAALAMKLERQYSKDEILELYLNSIYFGRGAYGIQAAAQAYYNKNAKDLTVAEAAQLAGLIPAPSAYDPLENPEAARRRYRYVIDRMRSLGWLDASVAANLRTAAPPTQRREDVRFNDAPFYLDIVRRELERELGSQIYTGLRVTTTLNLDVQKQAEKAYLDAFSGIGPTGALVALDPRTGGITALVGGENYQTDQFNLATAPRQAGSTFKPFALAAWIEDGKSPESYFDAPARIVLHQADDGKDWTVNNYDKVSYPPMTLREATWRSVNTVYAQVQQQVGSRSTAEIASRAMGLKGEDTFPPFASLVLGTAEVTPLQLAEAYNTFASGGVHRSAFAVVEARRGSRVVYRHEDPGERVLSERVAWGVTDVLEGVISNGSGWRARFGRPAAGKTGTTQDYGDAWFAGYTPELTAVVWMGNRDNNKTMPGKPTGSDLPAVTWGRFMSGTLDDFPSGEAAHFPKPDMHDLIVVRENPETPKPAEEPECSDSSATQVTPDDEDTGDISAEYFGSFPDQPQCNSGDSSSSSPLEEQFGDVPAYTGPGGEGAGSVQGDDSSGSDGTSRSPSSSRSGSASLDPGQDLRGQALAEQGVNDSHSHGQSKDQDQILRGRDGSGQALFGPSGSSTGRGSTSGTRDPLDGEDQQTIGSGP
jgi:penicillin-binding protein 1A